MKSIMQIVRIKFTALLDESTQIRGKYKNGDLKK
ncbi:hypothetical protein GYH30_045398 [Glycine max]|nr:hypothetical protein GYH30_045398 [Glycine max]